MAGLQGNTDGVGRDIVEYLDAIAKHFKVTLVITSGFRTPSQQANAMFNNWLKLQRGRVYKQETLPEAARQKLDGLYKTSRNARLGAQARQRAKASFLKLAMEKVGSKSKHSLGRAVDITQASVPAPVFGAITKKMRCVPEGDRKDIYHFESDAVVAAVAGADMLDWQTLAEAGDTTGAATTEVA